jgi:hypothetical protein
MKLPLGRMQQIIAAIPRPKALAPLLAKLTFRGGFQGPDNRITSRLPLVRIEPRALPPPRSERRG